MNNKVCIILPCNIYITPYYFLYEQLLDKMNVKFDLIIWNRDGIKENSKGRIISYNLPDKANDGNRSKVYKFLKFASFVKKVIKKNKYEKLLILGSYAGTAALLANFLEKKYKKNYWFDIRDYTYEWFKPYYWAMCKAIKFSYRTAISSAGYEVFLPKHEYIHAHNIDRQMIEKCKKIQLSRNLNDPIRISFIGNVRYYDENVKLLNLFKNDTRFILQYYGAQSEQLKSYCEINKIYNVDFYGRFNPVQTAEFYAKTDIINNVYGNTGVELTTALSNKLYFAASLHMPILVSKNTLMEKIACGYNFGWAVDSSDSNLTNSIYDWYKNIDINMMRSGCNEFMDKVLKDEEGFKHSLSQFLIEV